MYGEGGRADNTIENSSRYASIAEYFACCFVKRKQVELLESLHVEKRCTFGFDRLVLGSYGGEFVPLSSLLAVGALSSLRFRLLLLAFSSWIFNNYFVIFPRLLSCGSGKPAKQTPCWLLRENGKGRNSQRPRPSVPKVFFWNGAIWRTLSLCVGLAFYANTLPRDHNTAALLPSPDREKIKMEFLRIVTSKFIISA